MKNHIIMRVLIILGCWMLGTISYSQPEEKEFTPSGKPILTVFGNFHSGIFENKKSSAFAIDRAYLGYEYQLSTEFSIAVKVDIGSAKDAPGSSIRRYAYFKNAGLQYKHDNLSVSFGLIDMRQFKVQEKFWGHRYITKSFMDEYKFGSSADIGVSIAYAFSDQISADVTISNGEGYSNVQADSTFKYALGITAKPLKGIITRFYYDFTKKVEEQQTLAGFVGYEHEKLFNLGFEYNVQLNNSFEKEHALSGFSVYSSYNFTKKWQAFGRFDHLASNTPEGENDPWNLNKNGDALVTGVQYAPIKQVKIALNLQEWIPRNRVLNNQSFIYVNLEYKL